MDTSLKVSRAVKKSRIFWSSSNTFQLVTLSGIEGFYIKFIENVSMERHSGGMSLDVVLASKSASTFSDLGTNLMLKYLK